MQHYLSPNEKSHERTEELTIRRTDSRSYGRIHNRRDGQTPCIIAALIRRVNWELRLVVYVLRRVRRVYKPWMRRLELLPPLWWRIFLQQPIGHGRHQLTPIVDRTIVDQTISKLVKLRREVIGRWMGGWMSGGRHLDGVGPLPALCSLYKFTPFIKCQATFWW